MKNDQKRSRGERFILVSLFILYLLILSYFLFFAENLGRNEAAPHGVNLEPFKEIRRYIQYVSVLGYPYVLLNLLGNVLAFVPFGMFLPVVPRKRPRWYTVILSSVMFSVLVEVIQLVTSLGTCDVDDVILNSLGGIVGWCIYWMAHRIRRGPLQERIKQNGRSQK